MGAQQLQNTQAISCFCILGLSPSASPTELDERYADLSSRFEESRFIHSPQAWVQANQAMIEIDFAYERIRSGESEELDQEGEPFWPKLGQILVAAQKITYEQLQETIKEQEKSRCHHLGELLIEHGLLTPFELEAFLQLQHTVRITDSPYELGQRLIGLQIVPEDMVCIALMEHNLSQKPVGEILVDRGWLSREVLDALQPPLSSPPLLDYK